MKSKRETIEVYLRAGITMVTINARHRDVIVPQRFEGWGDLKLNLSWKFKDSRMDIGDDGIRAALTFDGQPYNCFLPWDAIWMARRDDLGLKCWPASTPADMQAALAIEGPLTTAIRVVDDAREAQAGVVRTATLEGLKFDEPQNLKARAMGLKVVRGGKTS